MPYAQADVLDAMDVLMRIEGLLSMLYRRYAELLPEYADFWSHLVLDELRHVDFVAQLREDVKFGRVTAHPTRFSPALLHEYEAEIQQRIMRTESHPIAMFDALTDALFLEKTYVEKCFTAIFVAETETPQVILRNIIEQTKAHLQHIEAYWQQMAPVL